jgi:hypothetical protein
MAVGRRPCFYTTKTLKRYSKGELWDWIKTMATFHQK